MHYYKRHIGDYAKKAGHLSPLEHGVYNLIIDSYYDREQAPTRAEAMRWARARTDAERDAVDVVLAEFFTLEGDMYLQKRIEEELAAYHGKAETNRLIAIDRENKKRMLREQAVNGTSTNGARTVHEPCTNGLPEKHDSNTSGQPNHKPLTTNQEPIEKVNTVVELHSTAVRVATADVERVFEYWQARLEHPAAKLDDKRARLIKARIKEGYSIAELCAAIDGVRLSPYHMGKNKTNSVYDSVELIFRDASNVERFRDMGKAPTAAPRMTREMDLLQSWVAENEGGMQ